MSDATPLQKLALIAGADDVDGETSLLVALSGREGRRASQTWYEPMHSPPPPLDSHIHNYSIAEHDEGEKEKASHHHHHRHHQRPSATVEDIQKEVTSELRRLSRSGDIGNHSMSSTSSKRISRAHIGAFAQEVYGDVCSEKGMNMDDIVAQREKSILKEVAIEANIVANSRAASNRSLPHHKEEDHHQEATYEATEQQPPARVSMARSASLGAISVHTDVSNIQDDRALLLGPYTDGFGTSDNRAKVLPLRNKNIISKPESGMTTSRSGLRAVSSSKSPRRAGPNPLGETQQPPASVMVAAPDIQTPTTVTSFSESSLSPSPKQQLSLPTSPKKARRSPSERSRNKEAALRSRRARTIYDRRSAQDQIVTPSPIPVKGLGYAVRALDTSDTDGGGWRCGRCSERTCGGFCHNCGAQCILVTKSTETRPVGLSPAAP